MDCDKILQTIYLSFDDEMDGIGRDTLEAHLATCSPCARRRRFAGNFLVTIRHRAVRLKASPELKRRILQALPHRQQAHEA